MASEHRPPVQQLPDYNAEQPPVRVGFRLVAELDLSGRRESAAHLPGIRRGFRGTKHDEQHLQRSADQPACAEQVGSERRTGLHVLAYYRPDRWGSGDYRQPVEPEVYEGERQL